LINTAGTILAPTNIALSETFFSEKEQKDMKIQFKKDQKDLKSGLNSFGPSRKRVLISDTQKSNMMRYHLLDPTMPYKDLMTSTQTQLVTKMVGGETVNLSRSLDKVVVFDNRVEIVVPDITTKNLTSVIHIVDSVLRPQSMDTPLLKILRNNSNVSKYYSCLLKDKITMSTFFSEEHMKEQMTIFVPQNSGVPSNFILTSYHIVNGLINASSITKMNNKLKIFYVSTFEEEKSKLSTRESTKEIRVDISDTISFNGASKLIHIVKVSDNINIYIIDRMIPKPETLDFSPLNIFYSKSKNGKDEKKKKKPLKMKKISIFYRLMTRNKHWMEWKASKSNGHFKIYAPTNMVFMEAVLKMSGDQDQIVDDKTFNFTTADSDQIYRFLQTHVKWHNEPGPSTLEFVKKFVHEENLTTNSDDRSQRQQPVGINENNQGNIPQQPVGINENNQGNIPQPSNIFKNQIVEGQPQNRQERQVEIEHEQNKRRLQERDKQLRSLFTVGGREIKGRTSTIGKQINGHRNTDS
jgi:uncharacterized surface protein with fasciclin (FAS1) repeats